MKKSLVVFAAMACAMASAPAFASELVTNGDFSAGNTGFTSTYSYTVYNLAAGTYYLTGNPSSVCGCFANMGDHATGTGTLAAYDGAQSGLDFFVESFAVVANSNYTVSYWATQLGGGPQASIVAMVNGAQVGGIFTPTSGDWQNYSFSFNSGAATNVTFGLRDLNTDYGYNDFAVDDISVTGAVGDVGIVPEPASWALMIGGFAMTGSAMRRRERRVSIA